MPIETFEPAQFKPYAVTTGTGKSWAKVGENGTEFGSSLNDDLQKVSDAATGGALGSQKNFDEMMARNQGGFSSPQFQSQYQGLGGGMASSMGPESLFRAGNQLGNNSPQVSFGNQLINQMPQPSFGGEVGNHMPRTSFGDEQGISKGLSNKYSPQQLSNGSPQQMNQPMNQPMNAQSSGPQGPAFSGGPGAEPFQNTAGNVGSFTPTEQPAVGQFQAQPFDINSATDSYFQQGMNVLNPAFEQQNSNLAQSLQGSGRGGLQLASGGMGAGGGGMMNPDAYATGNAQSNAMANLYQQSRQSALGEQAQNFGQNLNTNQQQMAQMGQQFGQDATGTQLNAALQGQNYGQGLSTSQQQAALQGQNYGQNLGTEQQRMGAMGQLFGQDLAGGQQRFNQNLQGFSANQQQLQGMSQMNQQQMANLGLFAGMEGNLFNQGLAAEQVRAGAMADSASQAGQKGQSSASRAWGSLLGGATSSDKFWEGIGWG